MHINLIIGLVFFAALWWVIREFRADRKAKKADPGGMLKNELEKRRAAQEKSRRASLRLEKLKKERLAPVLNGLREMIRALPQKDREAGAMRVDEKDGAIEVTLGHGEETETLELGWDVKNFDLELFAGEAALTGAGGDYIIRMPDGSMLRRADFADFMRTLSGLIADRLV